MTNNEQQCMTNVQEAAIYDEPPATMSFAKNKQPAAMFFTQKQRTSSKYNAIHTKKRIQQKLKVNVNSQNQENSQHQKQCQSPKAQNQKKKKKSQCEKKKEKSLCEKKREKFMAYSESSPPGAPRPRPRPPRPRFAACGLPCCSRGSQRS